MDSTSFLASQTITTKLAESYFFDLITVFEKRTGTPVLLNTSFNENEPIVDTPEQTVACFMRNDIDVLCIGPCVVSTTA